MRFVIKNTKTPTTSIRVPVQVNLSLAKFKEAVQQYFPEFRYNEYADKSFDYRMLMRTEPRIKSALYIRIVQPSEEEQTTLRQYLGPKGLEININYTNDNDIEARALLESFFQKLPITEMSKPKETEPQEHEASYHQIIEWYFNKCEQQRALEKDINKALKDVQFPKKQA